MHSSQQRRNRRRDSNSSRNEMTSSRPHTDHASPNGYQSDQRASRHHSIPSVLFNAQLNDVNSVILPGALCAVGGNQVITRIPSSSRSSPHPGANPAHYTPNPNLSWNPSQNPSVLRGYRRNNPSNPFAQVPGTNFGEGAFSAVAGRREVSSDLGRREVSQVVTTNEHDVLVNQNQLPPPDRFPSYGSPSYAPGNHSAVGGYHGHERTSPNVLMNAQGFRTHGGTLEIGAFTAVGGDQIFIERTHASNQHRSFGSNRR
ncbi:hypothetical protein D9757_009397 [Collybiopsis confluens]|uniref:Uncharacterized protein n=1 Tax=Collybiopsis confluens TaxID=2823264 RepID=A0A8H5G1L6_9AGAR|nr:hypothetical protein D9757_012851 [Collybiopsis confluens]KAF5377723.1 hypothetical protein D9757_009397 [Collybiopsis confluens]